MKLEPWWVWVGFNAVVFTLLVIDLVVFHRRPREMRMREALSWSAFWVLLALAFTGFVYAYYGAHFDPALAAAGEDLDAAHKKIGQLDAFEAATLYIFGYLIELSLSVDNLFVFLIVFKYFGVQTHHQHRVLFWGILGAVVLRATMILAGVAAIEKFHFLIYILGAFLVFTGAKLAFQKSDEHMDPEQNLVLRWARRVLPITTAPHEGRFFLRESGKVRATTLFLVLLVVESTDIVFAVDSIPVILGITQDPFIAYSSNLLAILGLRAMYFALSGVMGLFHYLRYGLAAVLVFIGCKMLLPIIDIKVPTSVSLTVVATLLGVSILASLVWVKEHGLEEDEAGDDRDEPPKPND
jgi:tellurite resistance protein TerC